MIRLGLFLAVVLASPSGWSASVGAGFGESISILTSARQAGTGGLALEDPWRQGSLLETSTIIMNPGLAWMGLGYQGGLGEIVRLGGECFLFNAAGVPRTTENSDGTYRGEQGTASAREWGGRAVAQVMVIDAGSSRLAAIGRMTGVVQDLPDSDCSGAAAELGAQLRHSLGLSRALTVWGLAGPLGRGGGRTYTGQFLGGGGLVNVYPRGLFGGPEGYSAGAEGQFLREGLVHAGMGGVYWFGYPGATGFTLYIRAGFRYGPGSVQIAQPRGGLGVLWRQSSGWGWQFDYAIVPIGELGVYHYATLGIRFAPATPSPQPPRRPPAPPPAPVPVPVVILPAAEPEQLPAEDDVIYFFPRKHEKARVAVEVKVASEFGAQLLDREGRLLRVLVEPHAVEPGTVTVEWDGTLEYGIPATFEVVHIIKITANNETVYRQAVPNEHR